MSPKATVYYGNSQPSRNRPVEPPSPELYGIHWQPYRILYDYLPPAVLSEFESPLALVLQLALNSEKSHAIGR